MREGRCISFAQFSEETWNWQQRNKCLLCSQYWNYACNSWTKESMHLNSDASEVSWNVQLSSEPLAQRKDNFIRSLHHCVW